MQLGMQLALSPTHFRFKPEVNEYFTKFGHKFNLIVKTLNPLIASSEARRQKAEIGEALSSSEAISHGRLTEQFWNIEK